MPSKFPNKKILNIYHQKKSPKKKFMTSAIKISKKGNFSAFYLSKFSFYGIFLELKFGKFSQKGNFNIPPVKNYQKRKLPFHLSNFVSQNCSPKITQKGNFHSTCQNIAKKETSIPSVKILLKKETSIPPIKFLDDQFAL